MQEYSRIERRMISSLSKHGSNLFSVLSSSEKEEISGVAQLCWCLENDPRFITFSCLSGDQERQELGENLGGLFTEKKIHVLKQITDKVGCGFTVFIDDTEPIRIWGWSTPQKEISEWCQLVIENTTIPEGWVVRLWSSLEENSGLKYSEVQERINRPEHALLVHRRLAHMKEFPNRKVKNLKGKDLEDAAIKRVAQYALQGLVLESKMPSAILFQTETPWAVKDPLYQAFRNSQLPIVHPLEERR